MNTSGNDCGKISVGGGCRRASITQDNWSPCPNLNRKIYNFKHISTMFSNNASYAVS